MHNRMLGSINNKRRLYLPHSIKFYGLLLLFQEKQVNMLLHRHKTLVYDDIFRSDTGFDFGVCLHLDFLINIYYIVQSITKTAMLK